MFRKVRLGSSDQGGQHQKVGLYNWTLVDAEEPDFPSTDVPLLFWDIGIITAVNPQTKTVALRLLRSGRTPSNVEWGSMMLDMRTGNGVYIVPKPGMAGLFFVIDGKPIFTIMTGAIEPFTQYGYTNDREEVPEGSFVAKTSRETKFAITPNLVWLQAANFAKILMKRVDKLIDVLFYSLKLTSLGGIITWITNLKEKTSLFTFRIRDKLPKREDITGEKPKTEDAIEVEFQAGEVSADRAIALLISKVYGAGEKITTETAQIRALRLLLHELFKQRKVNSIFDLEKEENEDLKKSFYQFASPGDTTRELLVESIVDAASFTSRAQNDIKNGVKNLSPAVHSIEKIQSGELVELGDRDPDTLDPDFEFFVPENLVEHHTDEDGNEIPLNLQIIAQARAATDDDEEKKLRTRLSADVTDEGQLNVSQPVAGTSWEMKKRWDMTTDAESCFDFDSGGGFRVLAAKGQVFLGVGPNGIVIGPDGVKIVGKKIEHEVFVEKDVILDAPPEQAPAEGEEQVEEDPLLSNRGTTLKITPDGITVESKGAIELRSERNITIEPNSSVEEREIKTKALRKELEAAAAIPDLKDREEDPEEEEEGETPDAEP